MTAQIITHILAVILGFIARDIVRRLRWIPKPVVCKPEVPVIQSLPLRLRNEGAPKYAKSALPPNYWTNWPDPGPNFTPPQMRGVNGTEVSL